MSFSDWTKKRQQQNGGTSVSQKTDTPVTASSSSNIEREDKPSSFGEWTKKNKEGPTASSSLSQASPDSSLYEGSLALLQKRSGTLSGGTRPPSRSFDNDIWNQANQQGGLGGADLNDYRKDRLRQLEAKKSELTAGLDIEGAAALDNEISSLKKQIKDSEKRMRDSRYNQIDQLEARKSELEAGLDLEGAAALDDEIYDLKKQLGITLPQQTVKTAVGVAKAIPAGLEGFVGSTANAWTSLYQGGQGGRTARNQEALDEYAAGLEQSSRRLSSMLEDNARAPGTWRDSDLQSQKNIVDDWQRKYDAMSKVLGEDIQQRATRESYKVADTLTADSARKIEQAKQGLLSPGRILVDATGSLIQNVADLGVNTLLGTPGSMGSFAMRAYGGGTQEARREMEAMGTAGQDGSYMRQTLYGIAQAAKEVATERMFGLAAPFGRAYGRGTLDELVESAVNRAVNRFAGTAAGKLALKRGLEFLTSAAGEGLEEFVGDWADYLLQTKKIYGGDPGTLEETVENSLYDFLVGAASGGFGDVVYRGAGSALNAVTGNTARSTEAQRAFDAARLDRASSALGEHGQKALNATYNGQTGAQEYYGGFSAYYQAGVSGQDINQVKSDLGKYLTKGQKYAAWSAGKNDAAVSLAREKEAALSAPVAEESKGELVGGVRYASLDGQDQGLVYDDFVREAVESGRTTQDVNQETRTYLTAETAERINTLAKDLGVRVRFVDSVAGGIANAQIKGSEVLVERNNPNPVMAIVGHELTHRMQQLAPEAYRDFREYVAQDSAAMSSVESMMDLHEKRGVPLTYEGALDEVTANYAGELFENSKALDSFIEQHRTDRTLLQKLRDAFRALWQKLTGKEKIQARTAEQKLTAALEAAAAQAEQNRQTAAKEEGGEAKYSLKEYTDEEKQEHAKAALEHFGRTYNWKETGYLTQDGKKIDFSGRHDGAPGGYRTVDHRDISDALGLDYGGDDYSGSMVQFMSEGNIRISPESGGINLSVAPTKAQEQALDDFISRERGEVILDIDEPGGDTVVSVEYPRGTRASKVLSDIRQYFKDGTVPQVSELAQFRYSLKETDSQGRELTKEQQEFFRDSKVVDEQGRLKVMYQGGDGSFTVFDRKKSSYSNLYGRGFYFTDSESHAGQYGNVRKFYLNITSPLSTTETTITKSQLQKFLEAVAENDEDYSFENYGQGATVDSVLASVYGKSDFSMLSDINQTAIGDMVAAVELFNEVNGTGFDGLILPTETVVFSPEQIKNVDNKAPTENPDIRYSLKGEYDLMKETRRLERQARKEGWSDDKLRQERRNAVDRVYNALLEEYGAIAPGEKPARNIQVPKKTSDTEKVSQTVRTILEAKATPEEAIPGIQELVAKGEFSYETITDKAAIAKAESTITDDGWGEALRNWEKDMDAGKVSKENTALGWALYNNAANSGHLADAMEILQYMVRHQRNAAQALQATRILKKLSPEGQLYGVVKSVEGLQKDLNERYGDKNSPELKIDPELGEKLLNAKDQAERDAALREIYKDIGRQMPSRFIDKWNAWRYMSMLGNPRTHVRNIAGNAGFAPVVFAKDMTATAIESAVSAVSGGRLERSKGLVGLGKKGRGLLSAAWSDYANIAEAALGEGKYNDLANVNKYIEEGRVIFKGKTVGKALEAARKANSYALDKEDMWFSQPHYAYALAQFCAAHKITEAEIRKGNPQVLAAARNYAIKEAQKATYRDTNALSQTISDIGQRWKNSKNPLEKLGSVVVEGILPFRKTPANILARGLEYSPLGLMKTLSPFKVLGFEGDLYKVMHGTMTGAEAIDNISAGLTGSGLLALGGFLAAQGLVRGHGDGDDKEKELEKLQGHQDYSMELPDGTSVTLDWLAPEALPFFVGVNLWETTHKEKGATLADWLEAVKNISDPMLEMSCLQGLNDALAAGTKSYTNKNNPIVDVAIGAATSYLTQGLPTIFGQGERAFGEEERETTYTENNAFLTPDMQYTLGKISGKIPGWEYQQIPYIDAWGRHESNGTVGARAFNNFLNPAYTSKIEESPVEKELLRLYQQTGVAGVLPERAEKSISVNSKTRYLSSEEYVKYAENKGQTSLKLVTDLTKNKLYSDLEDGEKAECITDAYTYANQTARAKIDSKANMDSWVSKAQNAQRRYNIPVDTYIIARNSVKDIESLKYANKTKKNGDTLPIDDSKGLLIMQEVYKIKGLNDAQYAALFADFGVGKTVIGYNRAAVDEALKKMQKQAAK